MEDSVQEKMDNERKPGDQNPVEQLLKADLTRRQALIGLLFLAAACTPVGRKILETPTPPAAATATPKPEIENGRFEKGPPVEKAKPTRELPAVITPEMVDQYFVGISAEEAQRLFAETGQFVLPFNPKEIEGEFSIQEAESKQYDFWVIGLRVPVGTIFYAPFDGMVRPQTAVDRYGIKHYGVLFEEGKNRLPLLVSTRGARYLIQAETEVAAGTPLMEVTSLENEGNDTALARADLNVLAYYYPFDRKLENLLLSPEGKLMYINQ